MYKDLFIGKYLETFLTHCWPESERFILREPAWNGWVFLWSTPPSGLIRSTSHTYHDLLSTRRLTYSFLQTNLLSADIRLAPITCMMNEHSLKSYRPGTHQRNVVFVLVLTLSDRIAGLAVWSTHESFGSSSQEASPAEGQPWREDEDVNGSTNWVWVTAQL